MEHLGATRAVALDDIVTELRTMAPARLSARLPGPIPSRADAGRLLARVLAVAAQGIEHAGDQSMPAWRSVPTLPDLIVGDQVRVLAHEFSAALAAAESAQAWAPDGRAPLADVVRDVAATADEVRRVLK